MGPKSIQDFIFNAQAANGAGKAILVQDFKTVVCKLVGDASSDGTLKFVKSDQYELPDFSAASSLTNNWEYVQVVDLQNNSAINGSTGTTITNNDNRSFEFNTNGARWVGAVWSARTGGSITLTCRAFNQFID